MRGRWFMCLVLAMLGCGARNGLQAETAGGTVSSSTGSTSAGSTSTGGNGAGGGAPALHAHVQRDCAPNDGAAISLWVDGTSTCFPSMEAVGALQFFVWGSDLAGLQSGSTLTIGGGNNAFTQGFRGVQMGSTAPTQATGGTLVFTTYVEGQGATGSYDVTFDDGTAAQGSFDAVWCPGGGQCG